MPSADGKRAMLPSPLRLLHMTHVAPSSFNSAFKGTDAENFFLKQVLLSGTRDYKSLIFINITSLTLSVLFIEMTG